MIEQTKILDRQAFSGIITELKKTHGFKGKQLFMPIRIALSGQTSGPDLADLATILGKDGCLRRLELFDKQLNISNGT